MLEIRRVDRYARAKYPRGEFAQHSILPKSLARRGAASALMLALIEACTDGGTGVTGPPPLPPTLVTENEARQIIEQTFGNNGIALQEDVPFVLHYGKNDSTVLELDGFSDSLQVGYEYIYGSDQDSFTPRVQGALDSLANESGPYIKPLDAVDYPEFIQETIEEFIDTLKANGII